MLTRILKKLNDYEVAGVGNKITKNNLLSIEFYFEGDEEIAVIWFNYNNEEEKLIVRVDEI